MPKWQWEERLERRGWKGWPKAGTRQYILIDEAQDSYWDEDFWNDFLKQLQGFDKGTRAILFCSYGSPSARPNDHAAFTPLSIGAVARVSLRPQSTDDIGLLLTREEYEELLRKHPKVLAFDEGLKSAIYEWTAGHVGAVYVLIEFILDEVSTSHKIHPTLLTERGELVADGTHNAVWRILHAGGAGYSFVH